MPNTTATATATARSWDELPSECWELILSHLNHDQHLEPLSLVSKQFLSLTNNLRSKLTVTDPMLLVLKSISHLLQRFHNLKQIDLTNFYGDINPLILDISASKLNLEALDLTNHGNVSVQVLQQLGYKMHKSLKNLICSRISFVSEMVIGVSSSFPYLEGLDISYPNNSILLDYSIQVIVLNLRNLRKINISGNHFITDKSLNYISKNCPLLSEIVMLDCCLVTDEGFVQFIRGSRNLVSFIGGGIQSSVVYPGVPFDKSFLYGSCLRVLSLSEMIVSNQLCLSIKEANLPLQSLTLSNCNGFTFPGISSVLSVHRSLNYLDLERARFLTDFQIGGLSVYFHNLTFINLNFCSKLTVSTFFTLVESCTVLEEMHMEQTGIGRDSSRRSLKKNNRIRHLKLAGNRFLDDECLKDLLSICPNLVSLDISRCSMITEHGLYEIGKRCSKVSEFQMNGCVQIRNVAEFELPKLEVLRLRGSGINNEGLSTVGKCCSDLLCLDLEDCHSVSSKGVKDAVGRFKRLREVNLTNCSGVSVDILASLVISRPSLRKIFPPPGLHLTDNLRNFFLSHGCMVYTR